MIGLHISVQYLRNTFYFSEVHRSMNALMGLVQKEGRHINFVRDPLRSYFDEPQKIEINLLYLHFILSPFLFSICEVLSKSCRISGEVYYIPTCLATFDSRFYDVMSIERYVGQSTIFTLANNFLR